MRWTSTVAALTFTLAMAGCADMMGPTETAELGGPGQVATAQLAGLPDEDGTVDAVDIGNQGQGAERQ